MKAAPVMATPLGLLSRMRNTDAAPGATGLLTKDLATVSGAPTETVKVALDALPVPTLLVLMAPLLLR